MSKPNALQSYAAGEPLNKVIIFATDKSPQTAAIRPTWENLKVVYTNVAFEEYDFETFKAQFKQMGVLAAPSFVFINQTTIDFNLYNPSSSQLQQTIAQWA